ncbi:MAG: hypothetical protein QE271_04540 [Bacteriovoracaceae bacterium]|nr:hypothetical protein [Bacteriovoracaceae bacterium]
MNFKLILKIFYILSFPPLVAHAGLSNTVIIQGFTTNQVSAQGYVSVKDMFDQVKIYPKSWIEKKMGLKNRIIANETKNLLVEIELTELSTLSKDCHKIFAKDKALKAKCPTDLLSKK